MSLPSSARAPCSWPPPPPPDPQYYPDDQAGALQAARGTRGAAPSRAGRLRARAQRAACGACGGVRVGASLVLRGERRGLCVERDMRRPDSHAYLAWWPRGPCCGDRADAVPALASPGPCPPDPATTAVRNHSSAQQGWKAPTGRNPMPGGRSGGRVRASFLVALSRDCVPTHAAAPGMPPMQRPCTEHTGTPLALPSSLHTAGPSGCTHAARPPGGHGIPRHRLYQLNTGLTS